MRAAARRVARKEVRGHERGCFQTAPHSTLPRVKARLEVRADGKTDRTCAPKEPRRIPVGKATTPPNGLPEKSRWLQGRCRRGNAHPRRRQRYGARPSNGGLPRRGPLPHRPLKETRTAMAPAAWSARKGPRRTLSKMADTSASNASKARRGASASMTASRKASKPAAIGESPTRARPAERPARARARGGGPRRKGRNEAFGFASGYGTHTHTHIRGRHPERGEVDGGHGVSLALGTKGPATLAAMCGARHLAVEFGRVAPRLPKKGDDGRKSSARARRQLPCASCARTQAPTSTLRPAAGVLASARPPAARRLLSNTDPPMNKTKQRRQR